MNHEPTDHKIVTEAIIQARKHQTEAGLLPNNNDIGMFCRGAKWVRDECVQLPTHIYEVMFEDSILDKEERISVHLTEVGANTAMLAHKYALWATNGIEGEEAEFNEYYSWYIKTTPILP